MIRKCWFSHLFLAALTGDDSQLNLELDTGQKSWVLCVVQSASLLFVIVSPFFLF